MNSTVLYFTQSKYDRYVIGSIIPHYGRYIQVVDKRMRTDLGDYFEIDYYYTGEFFK